MVHFNTQYGNFTEATKHSDGLAVLSILIEVIINLNLLIARNVNNIFLKYYFQLEKDNKDDVALRHVENFDSILHTNGSAMTVLSNPVEIEDLLPDNTKNFYRYAGSLYNFNIFLNQNAHIYSMTNRLIYYEQNYSSMHRGCHMDRL